MEKWTSPALAALSAGAILLAGLLHPEPPAPVAAAATGPEAGAPPSRVELPLVFVKNGGQLSGLSLFEARAPGFVARFERDGFRLLLGGPDPADLAFRFEGTEADTRVLGEGPLAARVNHLRGSDPAGWITGLPTFAGLRYHGLYEGVDLVVRETGGRIEYDLELEPGARPADLVFRCEGAETVAVDAEGDLLLGTAAGDVRQRAPRTWQVEADGRRVELESRYVLLGGGRVAFEVDGRQEDLAIVIDPVLVYSTFVGGSSVDEAYAVAIDGAGATYVTGWSNSIDFPMSAGAVDRSTGAEEAVVFKLAPDGSSLVYATYLGGESTDRGFGIAVDGQGRAVVVGLTRSTRFPTTTGAYRATRLGTMDAFVAKLSADGTALDFSTYFGGSGDDWATGVAVDGVGNAYFTGTTTSTDLATSFTAFQTSNNGTRDAFVTKLGPDGSSILYSTYLGGSRLESAAAIVVDELGFAYVVGEVQSTDFPTTPGAIDATKNDADAFVTKLNLDASDLVFSTYLGGGAYDSATAVAVDAAHTVHVAGWTTSTDFPVSSGAFQTANAGGRDGFKVRLAPDGGSIRHATYLGGAGYDACTGLDLDDVGAAWVVGVTESPDFPAVGGAPQGVHGGAKDGFVVQLLPGGNGAAFATFLGGSGDDEVRDVAIDRANGVVAATGVARAGLPTTEGVLRDQSAGLADGFVARWNLGPCEDAARVETLASGCGARLTVDPPRLGRMVGMRVSGASPGRPGVLLLGPAGQPPIPLLPGCELRVTRTFLVFVTDGTGSWSGAYPANGGVSACGSTLVLQGVVLDRGAGPLPFGQTTEALRLVFGS